jgi:hypothetical protein
MEMKKRTAPLLISYKLRLKVEGIEHPERQPPAPGSEK